MTKKEVLQIANDRGWNVFMSTSENMYTLIHGLYPFTLILWPEKDEFELSYNVGLFQFSSNKCGSFSNHTHFNKFVRNMLHYVAYLADAKEDLNK